MMIPQPSRLAEYDQEMLNFEQIIKDVYHVPLQLTLADIEVAGQSSPLSGSVGGDHLIFVDFDGRYDLNARIEAAEEASDTVMAETLRRCQQRLGILLADVCGHSMTDSLLAAMLHQAFLVGVG